AVPGSLLRGLRVSMGNPHFVIFTDDIDRIPFRAWGPAVETSPIFPDRTNVEFARVAAPREILVRVWERGAGETLACGSGAAAALAAAVRSGRSERTATVRLPGGALSIDWPEGGAIRAAGPARIAFRGEVDLDRLMEDLG
ncbi:MAG: diaminopimelate epimerase, partial [Planctomycetes bacterium]|nr:diaminopimelate epimerase [Planctomycetota bacterium]